MSAEPRPPLPFEPAQVKRELQDRIDLLLPRLGIKDRPRQGMVTPLNPRRADKHPGSFVIWTGGDGIGAWKDYAIGAQGDLWDLIGYLGGLREWIDAYWWALEWLGWQRGTVRSADQEKLDRERVEADRKAAEAKAAQENDTAAAKSLPFWLKAQAEIRGTVAWTYLTEARGLPLETLKRLPGAIRFMPALDHTHSKTGEVTTWPAMLTAMSHWQGGQVRALHRTYLLPDGSGKAPVFKAKKMRGPALGCAIRLWKGEGNLTPEEAQRQGAACPLIITEGIEDGLTAAIARPGSRVWAAGSLAGFAALGWPDCASAVVLVADNDWHEPQALAGFEKAEAHWRGMARGRPLKVVRAGVGKDLNDWARGVG